MRNHRHYHHYIVFWRNKCHFSSYLHLICCFLVDFIDLPHTNVHLVSNMLQDRPRLSRISSYLELHYVILQFHREEIGIEREYIKLEDETLNKDWRQTRPKNETFFQKGHRRKKDKGVPTKTNGKQNLLKVIRFEVHSVVWAESGT